MHSYLFFPRRGWDSQWMSNCLFAARAIAGDDGAVEQSLGNGEGEAEASHRVPVSLAKVGGLARMNRTIDRSRYARMARVISYLDALSIAINMYILITRNI